jgi:hypothetical protein
VYVLLLLLMVSVVPTVTVPDPPVKSPPLKVSPAEVVTVLEPDTVAAPPVMVIVPIVDEPPPTLVSIETFDPMLTSAPDAAAVTPGIHFVPDVPFQVHEALPVQVHRFWLFQLLEPPLE